MNNDFKESIMILAKKNIIEYNEIIKLSIEAFLIRYKLFIDDIETANEEAQKQKAQSIRFKKNGR